MSVKKHFYYLSNDHKTLIHAVKWIPDTKVRAVLQIAHGMVEFVERYDAFAGYLAENGILVVGNDHLGHGDSVRSREDYGYFAQENGNMVLIRDMQRLRKMTQECYPGLPHFILGHSMGSFLTRQYLCCFGQGLAGAVIMGTGYHARAEAAAGLALTKLLAQKYGWRYRSSLVDSMAFGGCNRQFRPERTGKDWLTRDEKIVDAYIADERCGFLFTLNAYHGLFTCLYKLTRKDYLERMPKELPILFTSGDNDPVGANGKGVRRVIRTFQDMGMEKIEYKFYPEYRHEILNELGREKVYGDILEWMASLLRGI